MIDFKLNVQEAVNAARFHHQFLPDSIRMERTGFSHDTIKVLSEKGHRLDFTTYWSGSESIGIDPKTGDKLGGSDARYYGKVAGY
jgi:gamma-glutamyltranspeptidase / glutathione hydrolase